MNFANRVRTRAALSRLVMLVFIVSIGMMMQSAYAQTQRAVFDAKGLLKPAARMSKSSAPLGATSWTSWMISTEAIPAFRAHSSCTLQSFPLAAGTSADLDIATFTVFNEKTIFTAMTAAGEVRLPAPDITLYRGSVKGEIGSWVYLAVTPTGISGTIIRSGKEYAVSTEEADPFGGTGPVMNVYAVTGEMRRFQCGVQDGDVPDNLPPEVRNPGSTNNFVDTLVAKIAFDADFESFKHYGSTKATEDYITARFGESDAIYERDLVIKLQMSYMRVWETKDPLQGNSDSQLLNVFGTYWQNNMGYVDRTLAVMISRKPISADGVSQGLAWLNVLCDTVHGYAFVKFSSYNSFTSGHTMVLAHEIGHNFGSPHTHSCWWNPSIDSCYQAEANPGKAACFKQSDIHLILGGGELMSYCHLSFGNNNTSQIFRDRTGPYVRSRADAAECLTVSAGGPEEYFIKLKDPSGGQNYCAGNTITLNWTASGNKTFSILLSKNSGASYDTVIAKNLDRTTRTFKWKIPNNFAPSKTYRLEVKDDKNDTLIGAMPADFEVKVGVFITDQIFWRNVCVGEGANFNVTAIGSGWLKYQWRKNGVDIPGDTTSTLQMQNMKKTDDSSTYTCVVTGDCSSMESKPALLRVFTGPVIVQQPNNDTVCVGGRAVLHIVAEGPYLTYKWLTLGTILGSDSSTLVIENVKATDAKGYYVEVHSPCGVTNTNTGFVIIPKPTVTITAPAKGEIIRAGSTYAINWKKFCLNNNVKLEFSSDGTTYTTLDGNLDPSLGTYSWNVPTQETSSGLIRMTELNNPTDVSIIGISIKKLPLFNLSYDAVSFGYVQKGTTAAQTLTITNNGNGDLQVSGTTINGTSYVVVKNGAPFTIPPSQNHVLNLEFTPLAMGRLDATLDIRHNATLTGAMTDSIVPVIGDVFAATPVSEPAKPTTLALYQNYPNPIRLSSPAASIAFDVPKTQHVRIAVYNLLGKEIRTLLDETTAAGRNKVTLDASGLSTGIYVLRLTSGATSISRVMHVLP